jgi:hypothetical protein
MRGLDGNAEVRRATMAAEWRTGEAKAWEQLPGETPVAYQAFLTYRDLGVGRSLAETARVLGKQASLMGRWARRHEWASRVLAWDREQARADESVLRHERDEIRRRELRDADQLKRLAMAKMMSLVIRDPVTGELSLAAEVKPRDAVLIYRLGLSITHSMASHPDQDDSAGPGDRLDLMSDAELRELVKLAEQQANQGSEAVGSEESQSYEQAGDEAEDDG